MVVWKLDGLPLAAIGMHFSEQRTLLRICTADSDESHREIRAIRRMDSLEKALPHALIGGAR